MPFYKVKLAYVNNNNNKKSVFIQLCKYCGI